MEAEAAMLSRSNINLSVGDLHEYEQLNIETDSLIVHDGRLYVDGRAHNQHIILGVGRRVKITQTRYGLHALISPKAVIEQSSYLYNCHLPITHIEYGDS